MELSPGSSGCGSQWGVDSVAGSGGGSPCQGRGQSAATALYAPTTGSGHLARLRPYQPSPAQNRLAVQTQAGVEIDQYGFNPAWLVDPNEPMQSGSGERFQIADSDAADTLLSMKRSAVLHPYLNAAVVKPGSGVTKALRNWDGYEDRAPSNPRRFQVESSYPQNWDALLYGRETQARTALQPQYWGSQQLNHFFSSMETNTQSPVAKELLYEPDNLRSGRQHQTAAYTSPKMASHHWPSNPALNVRDSPPNSGYYTRSIGTGLSTSLTGASVVPPTPASNRFRGAAEEPISVQRQTLNYNGSNNTTSAAATATTTTTNNNNNKGSSGRSSQNHQCHICGKSCTRPSSLRTHLRCHYGEKPFPCRLCRKSFSQAANLTAHMRVHSGEKPFTCVVCSRRFSQSSSVKTHMRTHTGERPYPCTFCSKSFSDSSTLSNHRRTHTGEKPYRCRVCCRSFSQSGNLNRHLAIHRRT